MRQLASEDVRSVVKILGLSTLITLSRGMLSAPLFILILSGNFYFVCLVFALGVVSDLLDGPIARARGEVSTLGGFLDHSCDALFVVTGFLALSVSGAETAFLSGLIIVSFLEYSWGFITAGTPLQSTVLGRFNGVSYYVLLGFWLALGTAEPHISVDYKTILTFFSKVLFCTTLLSIVTGIYKRFLAKS